MSEELESCLYSVKILVSLWQRVYWPLRLCYAPTLCLFGCIRIMQRCLRAIMEVWGLYPWLPDFSLNIEYLANKGHMSPFESDFHIENVICFWENRIAVHRRTVKEIYCIWWKAWHWGPFAYIICFILSYKCLRFHYILAYTIIWCYSFCSFYLNLLSIK